MPELYREVNTIIDRDACTGCGLCVRVCPSETITMVDGKAEVTGDESLNCGHCTAVCPEGAVTVKSLDENLSFETFKADHRWLPYGKTDPSQLVRLMGSRRSCRNYMDKPVEREKLNDLVRIATLTPSGSNAQMWTFTVLPDREAVLDFSGEVRGFFEETNKMAEKAWLRMLLRLIGKPELQWYYDNYYEKIRDRIEMSKKSDYDPLFHGAHAAILIGCREGATTPSEDALIASQNIGLAAHAMGLGTCYIGYAVTALKRSRKIYRHLAIPENETVHAVMGIGYPDEEWKRTAGRFTVVPRYYLRYK